MPERVRFHLDENVDPDIASALKRAGIDVTTSQEANLLAKNDTVQLHFARTQSRILVTHDDDFLILNSQGSDRFDNFPNAWSGCAIAPKWLQFKLEVCWYRKVIH